MHTAGGPLLLAELADHTGVTATFGAPLAPGLTLVPDALVGLCWPAVFSAIGSALTDDGFPVVEGLLSLNDTFFRSLNPTVIFRLQSIKFVALVGIEFTQFRCFA